MQPAAPVCCLFSHSTWVLTKQVSKDPMIQKEVQSPEEEVCIVDQLVALQHVLLSLCDKNLVDFSVADFLLLLNMPTKDLVMQNYSVDVVAVCWQVCSVSSGSLSGSR